MSENEWGKEETLNQNLNQNLNLLIFSRFFYCGYPQ